MPTGNGTKRTAVRLVDITGAAGAVVLPNGRAVDVRPASAFVVQVFREIAAIAEGDVEAEYKHLDDVMQAVQAVLPDVPMTDIQKLELPMLAAILAISMGHVDAVQAVLEHGQSLTMAATQALSPSRRTTKSSTRSRK